MPKILFKFDKERDLRNHWDKANKKNPWKEFKVNLKVKEICFNRKFEECRDELKNNFEKLHNSKIIDIYLESIESAWSIIEIDFFKRMDKLMKKNYSQNITAYVTTLGTCPYDPNEPSFMVSLFHSLPDSLKTCGHEIMHLYFHKYYWDKVEKEIGKEKTADLKEALTVLLNLEFKDLWFSTDNGYEIHQELRQFIEQEWKKKPDFDILLDRCIKYLKH